MKIFIVFLYLFLLDPSSALAQNRLSGKQCIEDMDFVESSIRDNHANMFHRISAGEFSQFIGDTRSEIGDGLSELDCYIALKKIVATIQDGHTQLFDADRLGVDSLRFPFRLEQFSDGIFVSVIRKDYEQYLGSQVLKVNGMPIADALRLTASITSMDNRFGRIRPSVQDLTFEKLPFGLGITEKEDVIDLELMTRDGKEATLRVEAVKDDSPITWSNRLSMSPTAGEYVSAATLLGDELPLHLRRLGKRLEYYWFDHLKDKRTVYVQFNQVANQGDHYETWAQFTERLWKYIGEHESEVDKLVIDLRYNDGGVARMFMPFLNHVIRSDKLNKQGSLFVLSGNRTFSASVIIMTEFSVHTDAIFVGTPAASPFNSFSDMTLVGYTPNIGAGLLVSARQNDNSWSDYRDYFPPDIPAPFSSTDYFSGVDPALDAVFSDTDSKPLGQIAIDDGAEVAFRRFDELKTKYGNVDWYVPLDPEALQQSLYRQGQRLTRSNALVQACEIFELNTLIFPRSPDALGDYADCNYRLSKFAIAAEYYEKTLELDPGNRNARTDDDEDPGDGVATFIVFANPHYENLSITH